MKEIINNLKNNLIIELSHWWGRTNAGKEGILITKDYTIYKYTLYFSETSNQNSKLEETKKLTKEEITELFNSIKLVLKENYQNQKTFDTGWTTTIDYQDIKVSISNKDLYDKLINILKSNNF